MTKQLWWLKRNWNPSHLISGAYFICVSSLPESQVATWHVGFERCNIDQGLRQTYFSASFPGRYRISAEKRDQPKKKNRCSELLFRRNLPHVISWHEDEILGNRSLRYSNWPNGPISMTALFFDCLLSNLSSNLLIFMASYGWFLSPFVPLPKQLSSILN